MGRERERTPGNVNEQGREGLGREGNEDGKGWVGNGKERKENRHGNLKERVARGRGRGTGMRRAGYET